MICSVRELRADDILVCGEWREWRAIFIRGIWGAEQRKSAEETEESIELLIFSSGGVRVGPGRFGAYRRVLARGGFFQIF